MDEFDDLIDVVRLECLSLQRVDHQLLVNGNLASGFNNIVVAQHSSQGVMRCFLVRKGTPHCFVDQVVLEVELHVDVFGTASLEIRSRVILLLLANKNLENKLLEACFR